MTTLEKCAGALEPSPTTEYAVKLAQAANTATDGIWAEVKEFRAETRTRFSVIEETQREHGMRLQSIDSRLDGIDSRLDGIDDRLERMEDTQKTSNTMLHTTNLTLQLILEEMLRR